MARTINHEVRAVRKDAFIDAASRLIVTEGYERMSVQDVLDEVGASRGAFYHYFDSKEALLEATVERMSDVALTGIAPILDDPTLSAGQKLQGVFRGIAQWKYERKELVIAILHVWLADDNAIVREKLRRLVATRLTPLLTPIVRQGIADGDYSASSADDVAGVLVSLIQGAQDRASDLFLGRQMGVIPLEVVERWYVAYTEALERILGANPGSLQLIEPEMLRFWFDEVAQGQQA
jgi:AcrR family transcriptional regulator